MLYKKQIKTMIQSYKKLLDANGRHYNLDRGIKNQIVAIQSNAALTTVTFWTHSTQTAFLNFLSLF